ncbi:Uncharacterised protein [Sphingomonas paucimobilis]|nr:Uncharacterised protein [Sphingomonas paucimobilis]
MAVDRHGRRLDATGDLSITAALDTARRYESQFSGAALVNVRSVTPYQQSQARLMAEGRFARVRIVGSADYAKYDFQSVRTLSGFLVRRTIATARWRVARCSSNMA